MQGGKYPNGSHHLYVTYGMVPRGSAYLEYLYQDNLDRSGFIHIGEGDQ